MCNQPNEGRETLSVSKLSIFINRPLKVVFDYISNPANNNQWQTNTKSAGWISDGSPGIGSTYKMVVNNFGRVTESVVEITSWDPPDHLSIKSVNGPLLVEGKTILTAQGDGTLVTYTSHVYISGFFKMAESLVSKLFRKGFEANLTNLKSKLEAG
jgi:hypothetical protein